MYLFSICLEALEFCRHSNTAGQVQDIFIRRFRGVLVPEGQQVIPTAAGDVLDVIFQIGDPGSQNEFHDMVEAVVGGEAEFCKYLIF